MTDTEGGEKMNIIECDIAEIRDMIDSFEPWDTDEGDAHDWIGWANRHEAMFDLLTEAAEIIALAFDEKRAWRDGTRANRWADRLERLAGIPAFWREEKNKDA